MQISVQMIYQINLTEYKSGIAYLAGLLAVLGKSAPLLFAELCCKHNMGQFWRSKTGDHSLAGSRQCAASLDVSMRLNHTAVCGGCSMGVLPSTAKLQLLGTQVATSQHSCLEHAMCTIVSMP